tara:strand:- start:26619 stop:30962 length:4344 start_codon:yes stop_codon:yes gene_type:complete
MALSHGRVISVGETEYAHEKEGIDFAIQALPDRDPFHAWALLDLLDPTTGRLHEIDLIVVGYSSVYVVELKHYGGTMRGDSVDWQWTTPEGKEFYRPNPFNLTRRKSQILASRLARTKAMRDAGVRTPWVQPLVFLSNNDIKLRLQSSGETGVVTQANFVEAITNGKFPGNGHQTQSQRIDKKQQRALGKAFEELGIRPRKGKLHVGSYELGGITDETDSYQDRSAIHRDNAKLKKRARIYLVPEQTSVERRQQLLRAANREAQLLYEVREHENILTISDFVTGAPLGPTVLFDAFEEGIPFDAYLRQNPEMSFADRIDVIEQVGRALDFCHKKQIVHSSVSPSSILVRENSEKQIEARLFNFQLGGSDAVPATSHWSALATDTASLYQAPELGADPSARTPQSDLYSLGAVAYFALTGRAPASNILELAEILQTHRSLNPRRVDDSVAEKVAEVIEGATHLVLLQRYDDVGEWVDLLLEYATEPAADDAEPETNPLNARKGDILSGGKAGDLIVHGVLGHGATSRVLDVERDDDGKRYALKVSVSPDHDKRLEAEAKVLKTLRHPRIVQCEFVLTIGERSCLLLSLAGNRTLHKELQNEGSVSLDYAARYGEDLLSAVEHLEENDILHRDIKPANVGVGAPQRKKLHLTLYDFSLAEAARSDIEVGTAAYRDPHLKKRGEWDFAGDRWSAAVTLHELLTGQRPKIEQSETGESRVVVSAERFDSSVRTRLSEFFSRSFAPEIEARFPDALTMRKEWEHAFEQRAFEETGSTQHGSESATSDDDETADLTDEAIAAIGPSTAIAALPLSNRAKNALDRAGILRASHLHGLADNRLSGIRGVGRSVAQEILSFRERWASLQSAEATSGEVFFPSYRGESLALATVLSTHDVTVLSCAGFATLAQVASAPKVHIEALGQHHNLGVDAVRQALASENASADETSAPTTLEGWQAALFPKKRKRDKHVRALFGLEGPLQGDLGIGARELATALGVTRALIYQALAKAKQDWQEHPSLPSLAIQVQSFVSSAGGAMALSAVATQLLESLPHDRSTSPKANHTAAAALARAVVEAYKDDDGGLRFVRFTDGQPWLFASDDLVAATRALGQAADALAARDIVAGPDEVARHLLEVVAKTPLEGLSKDKLAKLAASASKRAACSYRLEIYPRGMSAQRALELASSGLKSGLGPDEIVREVQTRYPDAEPLPPRPKLDTLLGPLRLSFDAQSASYLRPGEASGTSLHTNVASTSYTKMTRVATPASAEISPDEVAASEFETTIKNCIESRSMLVLGVSTVKAELAAKALVARFGFAEHSFDRLFLDKLKATMAAKGIKPEVVYSADQEGPDGSTWGNLAKLATMVSGELAQSALPPKAPLLITHPGLIDRYQLTGFLKALVASSKHDDAEATILLVPGHEGGQPKIEGRTVIPGLLPGQSIRISRSWLTKQRKALA